MSIDFDVRSGGTCQTYYHTTEVSLTIHGKQDSDVEGPARAVGAIIDGFKRLDLQSGGKVINHKRIGESSIGSPQKEQAQYTITWEMQRTRPRADL